ncbi:MAG: hypothetical protein ACKOCW_04505, partial [Planctomycetaceae bacterium]
MPQSPSATDRSALGRKTPSRWQRAGPLVAMVLGLMAGKALGDDAPLFAAPPEPRAAVTNPLRRAANVADVPWSGALPPGTAPSIPIGVGGGVAIEEISAPIARSAGYEGPGDVGPPLLRAPVDNPFDLAEDVEKTDPLWRDRSWAPAGFTGPSSVIPEESQESSHFVPIEDRWRLGLPPWDRYGKGHPRLDDYPYALGNWLNPYTQHVLKEDFPVIGQHTFFDMRVATRSLLNWRQVPTPNTPFESTPTPGQYDFYGNP